MDKDQAEEVIRHIPNCQLTGYIAIVCCKVIATKRSGSIVAMSRDAEYNLMTVV